MAAAIHRRPCEPIKDSRVILHSHPENRGKGAALRTAVSLATGTHMLPFDADLEYTPKDIPQADRAVLTGRLMSCMARVYSATTRSTSRLGMPSETGC